MYILAFETTGKYGSAGIIDDKGHLNVHKSMDGFNHLKDITILAEECLKDMNIKKSDISAVAASIGPGSFTGIRIGVSTARAIAQVLNVPCVSVGTVDSFKEIKTNKTICPILNARRGQVYGGVFRNREDLLKAGPYMLDEVLEYIIDNDIDEVVFYGDGIDAYEKDIDDKLKEKGLNYEFAPERLRYQSAELIAKAALNKYKNVDVVRYEELLPDYMRKAEAQQKLEEGSLHEV